MHCIMAARTSASVDSSISASIHDACVYTVRSACCVCSFIMRSRLSSPSKSASDRHCVTATTMAFFGLGAYGSDDEGRLSDSSDSDSDSDAAAAIVAAAPVALGPELPPSPKKEPVVLPSALEMFNVVDGPPSYLTKPMDKLGYKLHAPKRDAYDVEEPRELAAKHRASATVSSAPKRYRADEIAAKERRLDEASLGDAERTLRMQRGGGDALAMAVLGAAPKPTLGGKGGRAASGAMDVGEFLTKGPGALMPRKRGGNERMDGERRKRQAGQNGRDSVEWKSEAEMVLRQQFD